MILLNALMNRFADELTNGFTLYSIINYENKNYKNNEQNKFLYSARIFSIQLDIINYHSANYHLKKLFRGRLLDNRDFRIIAIFE